MEKAQMQIAGHAITRLNETEYETDNKEQELDFYFDTGNSNAVEVLIFDSRLPTHGRRDSYITRFYAANLEEAVGRAMALKRDSLFNSKYGTKDEIVRALRNISNSLSLISNGDTEGLLFPGWDEGYEEASESLIKEAAKAILATGVEPDEGTYVSLEAVASLIHYIADMME